MEAPEDGDLAWVRCHGLYEWPKHHEEDQVKQAEKDQYCWIVFSFW